MTMHLPPLSLASTRVPAAPEPAGQPPEPMQRPPASRERDDARQWHSAYERLLAEDAPEGRPAADFLDAPEAPALPLLPPPPVLPVRPEMAPPAPPSGLAPASATAQRLAAQAAAPLAGASLPSGGGDVLRVWQVELPAVGPGPGWQLHVEQARPLAPLVLDLRVPAAAQLPARHQLAELDRRLREAGHDTLAARCSDRAGPGARRPVDKVRP